MNLIDYIKGNRKGKEANRFEREALNDPFLSEAIEGFDSVPGNHAEDIALLKKQISSRSKRGKGMNSIWKAAAAIALLIFGFGGYIFIDNKRSNLSAKEAAIPEIIDIFVPEDVYIQNEKTINKKNFSAEKAIKAQIEPFKIQEEVNAIISADEKEILNSNKSTLIDIYVPQQSYSKNETAIAKSNSRIEIIAAPADSVISVYIPEKDFERIKKD